MVPGLGSSIFGGAGSGRGRARVGYAGRGGADEQRVQALGVRPSARGDCATELPGAGVWLFLLLFRKLDNYSTELDRVASV